jgi:tetratricopeptide (TPR) repeat protein
MSTLLCLLLSALPPPPATVAILPPISVDGSESWLGLAVADNLSTTLLRANTRDAKAGREDYPVSVFSWREATSAARGEGIDPGRPLSAASLEKVARQLGTRLVFTGSYRVKAGKKPAVLLKWRLVDVASHRPAKENCVTTNLSTLGLHTDMLAAAVLRAMGQKPLAKAAALPISGKALSDYARGLEILARQSLEPHAQIVVPALDLKKAHMLLESATQAAPGFTRAWVGRGLASLMLGDLAAGEKEILQAFAGSDLFEPQNTIGLYYLFVRQGKLDEAVRALTEATQQHPGFLAALGYLGSTYLRVNKSAKAAETFLAYERRVPASPWVRVMHARAIAYAGQLQAAIDENQAVQKEFPDSVMVIASLAARQAQASKFKEAVETLERGLAMHADHPALLTKLSFVQLQLGHPDVALSLAERAIAKLGDGRGETMAGYAQANLGHALAALGRKPEAVEALKKAAQLGMSVEDRLTLLNDEHTKPIMQDAANALDRDLPPPPPPAPPAAPAALALAPPAAPAPPPPAAPASPAPPPPVPESLASPAAPSKAAPNGPPATSAASATTAPATNASAASDEAEGDEDEAWSEDESFDSGDDWSDDAGEDEEAPAAAPPPAKPAAASVKPKT